MVYNLLKVSSQPFGRLFWVVNELPLNVRYALDNILLAGLWPGPSKPSREQIKHLFRPLIDELLLLESGHAFRLLDGGTQIVHVYLIGACCDKPAQALVQCIAEPVAEFGCGRCEIAGYRVSLILDIFILRAHQK